MTFSVFNFDISGIFCSKLHPQKIALISRTLEVSHLSISGIEIISLQSVNILNILLILFTSFNFISNLSLSFAHKSISISEHIFIEIPFIIT